MTMKVFLAAAIIALGALTSAANNRDVPMQTRSFAEAKAITAQKATAAVRRATGGRVVSATPTKNGGFKVRVLLQGGRVKTYIVDRHGNVN